MEIKQMPLYFSENIKVITGVPPAANAFGGTVVSDVVSLSNYARVAFEFIKGAGAVGTQVVTLQASAANDGANPTPVAFRYRIGNADGTGYGDILDAPVAGFTMPAGANKTAIVELKGEELPADKGWVHLKSVEGTIGACAGAVMIHLTDPRYGGSQLPSAV
jgi:hypothetical protein